VNSLFESAARRAEGANAEEWMVLGVSSNLDGYKYCELSMIMDSVIESELS
jgi:hypothetical protein